MLEPGIIEEIRTAWRSVGFSCNHPEMVRAVPAAADLKALLEIVFFSQPTTRRAESHSSPPGASPKRHNDLTQA